MSIPLAVSPDALVRLAAIAAEAGRTVLEHYHENVAVAYKADQTPVTAADHAAHRLIAERLRAWDATVPLISEEGEIPPAGIRHGWSRFWLVDPLDGTREFLSRNGEFTVNIALIEEGIPVLGAVAAPALNLLYYAGRGLGSWKREGDGPPVRLLSRPPVPGVAVRVVESRSHPSRDLEAYLATISVAERVPAGSSLKFCLVAEGKVDVYPRFGPTMEWDVAAGDCIFRYSGMGRERTSPLRYNSPSLRNEGFVIGMLDSGPEAAGHEGSVLWFTGLSGSGKSTIARRVVQVLEASAAPVEYLDGDAIRELFPATGFTRPERDAHIRRVGWLASRLERHGVTVVAALVSPYEDSRRFVRGLCRRFTEIWVSTPLAECERRDAKGLYARARAGEVAHFTGLDDAYEPPSSPELTIDTTGLSVDEAAGTVLRYLASGAAMAESSAAGPSRPEPASR